MRFINPQKESYHHSVISEFSDTSRFMMSGSAKGAVTDRYAWFADFSNKFEANDSFNPHTARISFFSDRQIFVSEYANVDKVKEHYPFIESVADTILSGYDHELTTKQYSKISNKYSNFDVIEFINSSNLTSYPGNDSIDDIEVFHSFYYAPVLHDIGYKIDKGDLNISPHVQQVGYWMYMWADRFQSQLKIKDYSFKIIMAGPGDDYLGSSLMLGYMNDAGLNNSERLVDYKIISSDVRWDFIEEGDASGIVYPYDLKEGESWSHRPYIGFPLFYYKTGAGEFTETDLSVLSCLTFPQITYNDIIERQKVITQDPYATSQRKSYFIGSGLSEEETDQSQIIYDIPRSCILNSSDDGYPVGQELYDSDASIVGVDAETERNRRYSAIVTTHPYMVTRPINNGEVVDYKFVSWENKDIINFPSLASSERFCLKIKAKPSFIRNLDRELAKREFNTDVLHVLYVNPLAAITCFGANSFSTIAKASPYKFQRQDYSLDDLVDGVIGIGNHYVFQTSWSTIPSYYTGGKAKICGLGYYWQVNKDVSANEFLKVYCTNYVPSNPVPNIEQDFSITGSNIEKIEQYELFRPMLKPAGMRGYIKIISRCIAYSPVILNDGTMEVIYDIEFPYCAGSYTVRLAGTEAYKKTQILYKSSYLNAGNQAIDSEGHYDSYNERYLPEGSKAFSKIELFGSNDSGSQTIETDPESAGGNNIEIISSPKNRLVYPSKDVFTYIKPRFIGLTQPKNSIYDSQGTFELRTSYVDIDLKMAWCVDNRIWKFAESKYSSYINRESPSYTFEFDVSALSNEFGRQQYKYAGIPDLKRWIFAKAIAFCHTITPPDSSWTHTDVSERDSKSDVVIELWDNSVSSWRPFSMSIYDTEKYRSRPLVTGLHSVSDKQLLWDNLYKVTLEKFDSSTFDYGLTDEEKELLDQKTNMVIYDLNTNKTYHVAYMRPDVTDELNKKMNAYVVFDDSSDSLSPDLSPLTPSTWVGPISIHEPYKKLDKNTDFSFKSCKVVESNLRDRYMDFGDKEASTSDFNKFVNNDKIYMRIRPTKARTYPMTHDSSFGYNDAMQWLGSNTASVVVNEKTNFPWYTLLGGYDTGFDWSKIDIVEHVRKFGLNYFSLQSK